MEHRQQYTKAFYQIKHEELQDQMAKIQIQKVKSSARNQALLKNIENALDQNESSSNKIANMRGELEI
jgi:chromosome segregation ATPase